MNFRLLGLFAVMGLSACSSRATGGGGGGSAGSNTGGSNNGGANNGGANNGGANTSGANNGGSSNGGSGGSTSGYNWYQTCGYPVCGNPGLEDGGLQGPACNASQRAGNACTQGSQGCDPAVGCGVMLVCADSDPTMGLGGCPISRAQFKRDIHYLSAAERAAYAEDLLALKLTKYRYLKDEEQREHLGFILEDVEPSVLAESSRDRVDLYSYTSMTVAALQEQAQQIEALTTDLNELRQQLAATAGECKPASHPMTGASNH